MHASMSNARDRNEYEIGEVRSSSYNNELSQMGSGGGTNILWYMIIYACCAASCFAGAYWPPRFGIGRSCRSVPVGMDP